MQWLSSLLNVYNFLIEKYIINYFLFTLLCTSYLPLTLFFIFCVRNYLHEVYRVLPELLCASNVGEVSGT